MFKLKRREGTVTGYKVRPEYHGDVVKTAADIYFSVTIDGKELGTILRRESAFDDFFHMVDGLPTPKYQGVIGPIPIPGKFENSKLKFFLGIDLAEVLVEGGDISGLHFDGQSGGLSQFTGKISLLQTEPMKQVQDFLATPQKLEISIGKLKEKTEKEKADERQGELPMDGGSPRTADAALAQDDADQAAADAAPKRDPEDSPYKAQRKRQARVTDKSRAADRKSKKRGK
jgi:hypothetical protein